MEDHVRRHALDGPAATSTDRAEQHRVAATWFAALLHAESRNAGAAHANLLGWLLALPDGLDPAAAATDVLAHQARHPQPVLSSALTALLQTVAVSPLIKLNRRAARRGRRLH